MTNLNFSVAQCSGFNSNADTTDFSYPANRCRNNSHSWDCNCAASRRGCCTSCWAGNITASGASTLMLARCRVSNATTAAAFCAVDSNKRSGNATSSMLKLLSFMILAYFLIVEQFFDGWVDVSFLNRGSELWQKDS